MSRCFTIICFFILNVNLFAQNIEEYGRILGSVNSSFGNFIYLMDGRDMKDSVLYTSTKQFVIERVELSKENMVTIDKYKQVLKKAKRIGIAGPAKTEKEILSFYPGTRKEQILQSLGIIENIDLSEIFNMEMPPAAFQMLLRLMETKRALGHVYLDESVDTGKIYAYVVTRIKTNGEAEPWGVANVLTGSGNYWLPHLKPTISKVKTLDSIVSSTWQVPFGGNFPNDISYPGDQLDSIFRFYVLPYTPGNLSALVYAMDSTGHFSFKEKVMGTLNNSQDTLIFHYFERCNPEDERFYYLKLEDEAGNVGIESDTVHLAAITNANLPLILAARSEAILDGIRVSWDSPTPKSYIAGVQVIKFGESEMEIDTMSLFSITDTSFIDYNIQAGVSYSYEIKTVFKSYVRHSQEIPATTQNVCKVFSVPLPPYSLVANPTEDDIKLNWKTAKQHALYGFYIYRGTNQNDRFLIAGPVIDTTFIDTAVHLSGKTVYYYSVMAMNLRQDTSIHSNVANAKPNRAIPMEPVSSLQFYQANEELCVSWHDARIENNFIDGYVLERRVGNAEFAPICDTTILMPSAIDTISFGNKYEYRVATVDMFGNLGPYSKVLPYSMPEMNAVDFVDNITVRNIQEGIIVSVPAIEYSNYKEYSLYRRLATEDDFTQLAVFPATQFSYVDTEVEEGIIYVYSVAITQTDGRQGAKGRSISRRRVKPILNK